jgi:hypothetical protein
LGVSDPNSPKRIITVNQSPAITSANSATFAVGSAGAFTVTTTGVPAPSLSETGALPGGVTLKGNGNGTASLSGTPAAGTAGNYPITITAHNGVGADATQSFTLTVNASGGGSSNFAYVAGSVTGIFNFASAGTTLSGTLHQNPGAGHLLFCAATWQSATATASVTDPQNGAWLAAGSAKAGVGSLTGYRGQMFYVPSALNAPTTVTLTTSAAVVFRSLECAEYSYNGTIASLDGTPQYSTNPASGGLASIGGLTTSNSSDMVVAACLGVDTSCSAGTGYTLHDDINSLNVGNGSGGNSFLAATGQTIQEKVGAAAGSQTATFGTGTSNDNVILGLLAVKGAPPAQTAPTITSGNATTFTVGTAGTFTVTSTGSPTPTLSKTGALPNNVTFVDNGNGTATLGGTPAAGTAGSYPITIKAHNGVGADASQSFTLTVNGSGGGSPNFTYVAGSVTGMFNMASPGTTLTGSLHQNPGAGHLLACAATWQSATATASVTDTKNGTWTAVGVRKAGIGSLTGYSGQMFFVPAAVNGPTTVTLATSSATVFRSLECAEYSYTGTTTSLDGTPQYSTAPASGGVASIGGLTTSTTSDIVIAACLGVDTTCSAGPGYTLHDDSNSLNAGNGTTNNSFIANTGQTIQEKVGVAAGAQSATFGAGTNDNVILGLLAFKAAP